MIKLIRIAIALQLFALSSSAQVTVQHLLTENLSNPVGLDSKIPRFTWQLVPAAGRPEGPERNIVQTAYEIHVSVENRKKEEIWNSGKVTSLQSVHIPYAGPALASGKRYYWQVRIWDNKGRASSWSTEAWWQTAFFDSSEWKAQWIQPGYTEESALRPSPLLRKDFSSTRKLRSATAYITAHGLYEARINGSRIGDAYLTPGWTSYQKRLQYQAYDVTNMIREGKNAIGVQLASGWYRGYIGYEGQDNYFGKDISLLFQLVLTYTDGSTEVIGSDGSWKSSTGAIRSAEIYNGEMIDSREDKPGWDLPGYDDSGWSGVKTASFPFSLLVATCNEPIRAHETFAPVKILTTPKGEKVIDFGQNLVGWVRIKVKGNAGDKIRISHAEVLDKDGNFYTANLRSARAQDVYVLKGGAEESFEPRFTFHGFRYIRIEGYPGEISADHFTAVALYSDMEKTGDFSCSNALINQLQHNIQWGQRGNFLDVPTDCPQRDERLGWTGDAQVFSRTAAFNMGVESFFTKWLKDVAADQSPSGAVPFVIPNVLGQGAAGSTGWADVATIIPWNMYLAYGDRRILEEQYPSMKAWVEYMHGKSKDDLWNTGFHFGDWLFYRPEDDNDGRSAVTDKYLIAQCFYAHSTQLMIDAATVLGKTSDADSYAQLLKRIKAAFLREYMTPNGRLVSSTQTAYTLALQFDMLPEDLRKQAAERLVQNIKSYNYHLTTGFLGTPYLCHVLSRFGYTDIAYRLLLQESYPSWLYPVKMGATTIWERWDGMKPDSTFESVGMNSFNHYAYGAIGDWMYREIAGLDTEKDGPGYQHSRIWPHPGGALTEASASLQTGYGRLSSHWHTAEGHFYLDVEIPANTSSTLYIPAPAGGTITESGKPLGAVKDLEVAGVGQGYLEVRLGSGVYHFEVKE